MNNENGVDAIYALIVVIVLIVATMWTVGFYQTTYQPPPDTLPTLTPR